MMCVRFVAGVLCVSLALAAPLGAQPNGRETQAALVDRYCLNCHNDQLETGGLSLEDLLLDDVAGHAETYRSLKLPNAGSALPGVKYGLMGRNEAKLK